MNDKIEIPEGWSPELALAVSELLMGLDSAIWDRYGAQIAPLISDIDLPELRSPSPCASDASWADDDKIPF